jgi:hypothetical protein
MQLQLSIETNYMSIEISISDICNHKLDDQIETNYISIYLNESRY